MHSSNPENYEIILLCKHDFSCSVCHGKCRFCGLSSSDWKDRALKAEARLLALEARLETLLTTLDAEQFPGKRIL